LLRLHPSGEPKPFAKNISAIFSARISSTGGIIGNMRKKLLFIFLIAFLIRLIALDQSLWLDEGVTARVVQSYNFLGILKHFSPFDFHPPLYYFFMKTWVLMFGTSVISLRLPSVLFSLLTGYVVYRIGKKLKSESLGFWSSVFFLFNPLILYYSQEARMYIMATFLLTASFLVFLDLDKRGVPVQSLFWFNVLTLLGFLTFYGSVFFIGTFYLVLLFKKKYRLLFLTLPGMVISMLSVFPLLSQQVRHSAEALHVVKNWSLVLGRAEVKNILLIPLKFTVGRISFYPKYLYYLVSGLCTFFVFYFVLKGFFMKKRIALFFFAPLLFGFVISFFTPLLQYFRFLYVIPVMCILIALGTKKEWQRALVAFMFLSFSLAYVLFPNFHREDWGSLASSLPRKAIVYMIPSSADALTYYRKDLSIKDVRNIDGEESKMIVIPYTSEIYGLDLVNVMNGFHYRSAKKENYRELTVEYWLRRD